MHLLDEWKRWTEQVEANPDPTYGYFLREDGVAIEKLFDRRKIVVRNSWTDVVSDPEFGADENPAFHLGLLPQPFMGDLKNSEIYILTLNPGYSPVDYFGEYCVSGYREALLRNLRQNHSPHRLPNLFLDPQFAWSGGYEYWHSRLRGVIAEFAKERYAKARSKLGEKLATIELVPYHSSSSSALSNLPTKLHSSRLAKEFVKHYIVPRVRSGKAIAIVLRGLAHWRCVLPCDLSEADGLIRYDPKREARTASLSPSSRGGNAIIEWFRQPKP